MLQGLPQHTANCAIENETVGKKNNKLGEDANFRVVIPVLAVNGNVSKTPAE